MFDEIPDIKGARETGEERKREHAFSPFNCVAIYIRPFSFANAKQRDTPSSAPSELRWAKKEGRQRTKGREGSRIDHV